MTMDKSVKVGIGTSVVATVLFIYFLDPILSLFGRCVVQMLSHLYSGYIDNLFEKVALCSAFDPAFSLLSLTMGFICGASFGVCAGLIAAAVRRRKGLPPPSKPFFARLSLGKIIFVAITFTLLMHLLAILSLWGGWFQLKTTSSFHQHMKAVAPYLTEQEEELMWSQWTQMRSREDYEVIYSRLQEIAQSNDLRLPENKVYSATSF